MLATPEDVKKLLAQGKTLVLAGDEELLASLPRGAWIGGTIPYFMGEEGGVTSRQRLFVQTLPAQTESAALAVYDVATIKKIGLESPDRGYTVLVLPAFSALHQAYALEAPGYTDLFLKVVAGWIAGIHLDDAGKRKPKVFDGRTGTSYEDRAMALHVTLPAPWRAQLDIVNIFTPAETPELRFPSSGFEVGSCRVNGEERNFHDFLVESRLDVRLPLIAETFGALINVSIQSLDPETRTVKLYAPVFEGVSYRPARPLGSYSDAFKTAIPALKVAPAFSCNCVLNYLYGNLEGQRTAQITGPMTFGEIGFQLLNQTLVYVTLTEEG